jgi:hypothetical protein
VVSKNNVQVINKNSLYLYYLFNFWLVIWAGPKVG